MANRIPTFKLKSDHKELMAKKRELAKRMKDPKIQARLKEQHERWGEQ